MHISCPLWTQRAMTSPKEKHVRGSSAAAATVRASDASQTGQLASTSRIDASEVEIRIDGSEHGTQRYEHYENNGANEHCRLLQRLQVVTSQCYNSQRHHIIIIIIII